jgi:hypothetical protein
MEVYDILPVGIGVVRGVTTGFGTNAARAVDQHRSASRRSDRRPTPADAGVRLVTPRVAAALAAMGQRLDEKVAANCGVQGALPAVARAGEVTMWTVDVVNRAARPLGTVLPRPVKVGVRWFRLAAGRDTAGPDDEPIANPLGPIGRIVPPNTRTQIEVPVEVPDEPGRYEVRVALRQPGLGWFGVRTQAQVTVKADG